MEGSCDDDGCPMLVIMKNRNTDILECFFDMKAGRCCDVLEIDTGKRWRDIADELDNLI